MTSSGTQIAAVFWLVFSGLLSTGCHRGTEAQPTETPPDDEVWLTQEQMSKSNVRVAEASEQDLPRQVNVGGRIAFDDLRVTHVLSPVTGRISRVIAQPGQKVKKGAPLMAILSPDVGSAFSDLIKAQADLDASEHEFHRQQQLFAVNAAPKRDLEASEDNYRKSKAELQRVRQKAYLLKSGDVDSVTQEYVLRSPIEGQVIARFANPGIEVQGQYSGGTSLELFTIGDIDEVWLYADVPESELPKVKPGADMNVKVVAYPDHVFKGHVEWISETVDPMLRTARIRCALPNPDRVLKPEMYGSVAISMAAEHALALPREAIVPINDQAFAFVQAGTRPDGRLVFKRRRLHVNDDRAGNLVSVVDGLKAGEKVVIEGSVTREQPNDEAWVTEAQFRAAEIRLAVLAEQSFEDAISVGGRLTFDDLKVSHVFSPVTGRITRVLAQPGQHVKKQDPLLAIVSPDVGSAFADLVKAQADLTASEHEYQRQKELYAAHAGAQRDLEAAEGVFKKAKAELDRALQKTRLLNAGAPDSSSQEYILRSPIEGEVVARNVNPGMEIQGQYSGAASAVELFTIGDLSELWLLADVYETDLPSVKQGAAVSVSLEAYPGKKFNGTVDWVSDVLDPALRTAKVRCVLANPEHLLKPEMYEAVFISAPRQHMLAVPRESVLRIANDTYAFVVNGKTSDGKIIFKRRPVVVNGETTGNLLPVVSGLAVGDTVAVDNAIFLLGLL